MPVFNPNNTGHLTKKYPLFLGEDLGLFDTVNLTYPILEELYQSQVSQIWNEFEVDLTQDAIDMRNVPKDTLELMVKTISWQHLADSAVSKSISGLLMKHVTNSELEGLFNVQTFFETIHARTYSHIVKQTFVDANQMLQDTYTDTRVLLRSKAITDAFDELEALPLDAGAETKRKAILKTMFALFAMEGISFMSSFAVTFGITETKVFQGIGQLVKLICRDEILHTHMDYNVIDILLKDPVWKQTFEESKSEIKEILDTVTQQEYTWTDYLFSEGRQVIGLNAKLLKEQVNYCAYPIYSAFGIPFDFDIVTKNPLPYMDKYVNSTKIQVANQEIQNTAYKVGAVVDDSDDFAFEFEG